MTINDKVKGKPVGWKKGSFMVLLTEKDSKSSTMAIEFVGMARPFTPLRECEVEAVLATLH